MKQRTDLAKVKKSARRTSRGARGLLAILPVICSLTWTGSAATRADTAEGRNGMVVSVSEPASLAGVEILKKGGTAVDAAVAAAFALAVTFPEAGNIGGGGFMLVYPPGGKDAVVIDFRETAPAATDKDTFLNIRSQLGHKAVGIPGTVRGLALAHQRFGKLPWKTVVQPAVDLAEHGFAMDQYLASGLNRIIAKSRNFPELQRVLGKEGGSRQWQMGDRLVQKDLAATFRLIAEQGPDAFYQGSIADQIVAEMKTGGGFINKKDLTGYEAKIRAALHGTYRGYDIYCPPSPGGGVVLLEMLNILENFDLAKKGPWHSETLHLIVEAMRRAYCDRARYLGDPDFVTIPDHLTSKDYAKKLAASIPLDKATASEDLSREIPLASEGNDTTHFSVIDRAGLAVSLTYTLEESYGSRVVVRGAGFLLNNQMGDFNWRPGYTNRRGTIGTQPNQIAPGKRMLSSQTPTIVAKNGKVFVITGSPGGRTIINTVLWVVLNVLEFDLDLREAVDAPRFHHQWFPDQISFERAAHTRHAVALEKLRAMGHAIDGKAPQQGDAHSIGVHFQMGMYHGCADSRRHGKAVGY
jgi:gamma-glutamyltranspeptidase/glutathione hydrolase